MASSHLQETQVQDAPDQMDSSSPHTGVNVEMKADRSASVIVPVFNNSNISGSVHINYGPNPTDSQDFSKRSGKHTVKQDNLMLSLFLKSHKSKMREKAEHIFDVKKEEETYLKDVYTELFITEGDIKGVNEEHEILQIDEAFKSKKQQDRPIHCNDIFNSLRQRMTNKKIVLTKGIAGIGKTVSVHKFILDWAEGKANQDIDAMFLLPFREINLFKDDKFSLQQFLSKFHLELKDINITNLYKKCNLAFIFDGLDESRLPLNFKSTIQNDVEERSSVDELFTNLVKGHLLPSALVWVTSRPAAANQIPSEFVGLFTEVRGFTDQQKEEYFRKRISDESQASRIISHIKTSRSLYIMCHIPVFCWITAIVLLETLIEDKTEEIPTTLTEMYIHFLIIQMNMKNRKHDEDIERNYAKLLDSNKTKILKLAKLAFEQLKKGNTMFYEEELKKCDINVSEDTPESTGMLTEIFKKEAGLHEMKVFCFVHLSVQEFLAALHVFMSYLNKNLEELQFFYNHEIQFFFKKFLHKVTLHDLLKNAVDKAMKSKRGHFDLFLRFLLGISLESNQKLLNGLFNVTVNSTESITKVKEHIKQLQNHNIQAETSVNLYYCLLELKDKSLYEEIQRYLSSGDHSGRELSASMCSVLTYILLMSDEVMDEFDIKMYNTSPANYMRLIPAVRCCRKANLKACDLTAECCESLSSALQSSSSHLMELDLSHNTLIQDSGVKLISDGLKSPNCKLQILRLSRCKVTEEGFSYLVSAMRSNPLHLRELDLTFTAMGVSGGKLLSDLLKDPHCRLKKLSLAACDLTIESCKGLSSALQSSNSPLIDLDLSYNDLQDSGVKLISDGLKSPNCELQILRLSDCNVKEEGVSYLTSALKSNPSHIRDLDLRHNHPEVSGLKLLSDLLEDPNCRMETLGLERCNLNAECCESLSSALQSSNSNLIDLDLSYNNLIQDSGVKLISDGLKSPNCKLQILRLCDCKVTEEGISYLASALRSNPSHIRDLDLSYSRPGVSGVKLLSDLLKDPNCNLETLRLTGCKLTVECCESLSSALQSSNSHLIELNLSHNNLIQDLGVKVISDALKSPNCKLEILRLFGCGVTEKGLCYLSSANPSHLRELDLSHSFKGVLGLKKLFDLAKDPNFRLENLDDVEQ